MKGKRKTYMDGRLFAFVTVGFQRFVKRKGLNVEQGRYEWGVDRGEDSWNVMGR